MKSQRMIHHRFFLSRFARLLFILLFIIAFAPQAYGDAASKREGRLKAAWLYYLAKFVQWPESSFSDESSPLIICITGEDSLNEFVQETLAKKKVHKRSLETKFLKDIPEDPVLQSCHLIYIGKFEGDQRLAILKRIAMLPILSVSGADDITAENGIIHLFRKSNKLRIRANLAASKESKLKLSAELLNIAEVVNG